MVEILPVSALCISKRAAAAALEALNNPAFWQSTIA